MVIRYKVGAYQADSVEYGVATELPLDAENVFFDSSALANETADDVQEVIESLFGNLNNYSGKTAYVSNAGSDSTGTGSFNNPFATLTGVYDALVAGDIFASQASPLKIFCDAGNYLQAPVDFSSYTYLAIFGAGPRTVFIATNPNADLITLGNFTSTRSISCSGVTNASNWHLKVSSTSAGLASINDTLIATGSNGVSINSTAAGFQAIISTGLVSGLSGVSIEANNNTTLVVNGLAGAGNGTTSIAIEQNGDSEIKTFSTIFNNYATVYKISGDTGILELNAFSSIGNVQAISQVGDSQLKIFGGEVDVQGSNITDTSKIDGFFFNRIEGESQFRIINELSVGLPNLGRESVFGEGDSYTLGMLVYTFDGTSYTSVSADAVSLSGSTFSFPNTSVNSAIYVSTAFDTGSPLQFFGIKMAKTVSAILGSGDILFEYYNGTTWVEFNHMITDSDIPYTTYSNRKFTTTSGKFQVYFEDTTRLDWAVNDPVSLGVSLHWVRFRIATASITTAPVFEQFKIHTNRLEINSDGFVTKYGLARTRNKFPITFAGLSPVPGKGPNNNDAYISDNLGISFSNNSFPSNQSRSIVFNQIIPFDLDSSSRMTVAITYLVTSATAGGINLRLRWATTNDGDGVYTSTGGAPATFANERNRSYDISIGSSEQEIRKTFEERIEVPEAIAQTNDGNTGSQFWLEIERVTNDSFDNYNGDMILTDIGLFYTSWREGGYTGDFA